MKLKISKQGKSKYLLGFTLVEQLMGGAIMAMVFSSIFMTINLGLNVTQATQEDLRATQILTDKMESMRLYTWNQITNGTSIPTNFTSVYFPSGTNQTISYAGTVTITNAPFTNNFSGSLRLVSVQLSWVCAGVTRFRQEFTLVSSNGLQAYVY